MSQCPSLQRGDNTYPTEFHDSERGPGTWWGGRTKQKKSSTVLYFKPSLIRNGACPMKEMSGMSQIREGICCLLVEIWR